MVERLGLHEEQPWISRLQDFKDWQKQKGSKPSSKAWTWEGSSSEKWSKGSSKRGQSVPVDISQRTDPEEKGLEWRTLDEIDTRLDYLFPESEIPCPVEKSHQLPPEQQENYIKWIRDSLKLEKHCKDPRIYCAYCDMSNHPRFTCKHVEKHRNPLKEHRCTLCKGKHAPFQCPRAQVNGGPGQPNWYKQEYKKAKSEGRAADYRWGTHISYDDVDGPASKEQPPQEVPPPTQCAAAAMMHGMAPASSLHGGFRRTSPMAFQVHFQAWLQCSMTSSFPTRTFQFQRIYGISTFHSVLTCQAPCRRSFVTATLCRVHTILRMADRELPSQ